MSANIAGHDQWRNVFSFAPRVTITRNVIHDIGRFAPGEGGCAPTTLYYQNHDHGIYADGRSVPGANDALISSNIFYNHRHGWAIEVYPGTLAGVKILNNTFAFANPYNVGHIIIAASTRGGQIINNVFLDPLTAGIYFYAGTHVDLVVRNNLSSRLLATSAPDGMASANNIENTDPRLAPFDFRPKANSPVIDHGLTLAEVPTDVNGVEATAGWRIRDQGERTR
jgi:hypothetical protein